MAKKKSGNGSGKRGDDGEVAAPEGFNINAGRDRGDGWVIKEEGNEVMGRLLGRQTYQTKRGKARAFYQIKLAKKCRAQVPNPDFNEDADESDDNKEYVEEILPEGATVNVDEFKKLEDLKPFTLDGGVYDVWFVMGGKIDIGDDQTMWTLQAGPKLKPIQLPSEGGRSSRGREERPF